MLILYCNFKNGKIREINDFNLSNQIKRNTTAKADTAESTVCKAFDEDDSGSSPFTTLQSTSLQTNVSLQIDPASLQ